jgi:hypothetical protein
MRKHKEIDFINEIRRLVPCGFRESALQKKLDMTVIFITDEVFVAL